ncbi:MAG: hypothetical protein VKJ64_09760 [Leptolyngbyaceae bacterium]|nr:hypothetical protein [Leptolyngbyaceae bacterium]
MGSALLTQKIQTGDITVMSNVTSITVVGTKVSRLADLPEGHQHRPSTVHVDFEVKQPTQTASVLEATETLGMILTVEDAVELGEYLLAMGLGDKSSDEVASVMARINQHIQDFS